MISGREPNIVRCMSPKDQAKELAQQHQAEKKLAAESEKTEQKLFSKWLKEQEEAGRLYFINPRSDKPSTITPGHPDYTIWIKGQPSLFIEMKGLGGELSPEQIQVIGKLERLDHGVFIAWNHLQAQRIVEFYLSVLVKNTLSHDNTIPRTECPGQATIGQT